MLTSAAQHQQVQYELSPLNAHVYGDFGYVRGIGVALKNGGTEVVKTRFTDIFVYRDGRWQCVCGTRIVVPCYSPLAPAVAIIDDRG
jgi:hypothetical protein